MKKIYLTIILAILALAGAGAQTISGPIKVEHIFSESVNDSVRIRFTAHIHEKAASRGTTLAFVPVVTDGNYRVSLPAIVVQGKRAATDWQRHEWAADRRASYEKGIYTENGGCVAYETTVPFQEWMYDARLDAELVTSQCCSSHLESQILSCMVVPAPQVFEPMVTQVLTETFPFVLPLSEFDPNEPIKYYDDERDNSITIYYRINRSEIEEDYADNRQTLINLIASIDLVESSFEAKVGRIVVSGFASPEGPYDINERLAWERAVSVREYIQSHTDIKAETISLFNGSSDWRGLRLLIEKDSNIPGQQQVLDIIENKPIQDEKGGISRMGHIKKLNGGRTYAYLAEHIFPRLRNGTFIRVYYQDK